MKIIIQINFCFIIWDKLPISKQDKASYRIIEFIKDAWKDNVFTKIRLSFTCRNLVADRN